MDSTHSCLVMVLNVKKVSCFSKAGGLVKVPHIAPDIGIVHHSLLVALSDTKIVLISYKSMYDK